MTLKQGTYTRQRVGLMSYKTIKPTAEKLKKLAEKATRGPWSAQVKATDCIIYPAEEENEPEQTIIFENQFPDSAADTTQDLYLHAVIL